MVSGGLDCSILCRAARVRTEGDGGMNTCLILWRSLLLSRRATSPTCRRLRWMSDKGNLTRKFVGLERETCFCSEEFLVRGKTGTSTLRRVDFEHCFFKKFFLYLVYLMYIIWVCNTGENVFNVNEVEGGRSKKQGNIYRFKKRLF